MSKEEIKHKIKERVKFTPDSILAFNVFIELEHMKQFFDSLKSSC